VERDKPRLDLAPCYYCYAIQIENLVFVSQLTIVSDMDNYAAIKYDTINN